MLVENSNWWFASSWIHVNSFGAFDFGICILGVRRRVFGGQLVNTFFMWKALTGGFVGCVSAVDFIGDSWIYGWDFTRHWFTSEHWLVLWCFFFSCDSPVRHLKEETTNRFLSFGKFNYRCWKLILARSSHSECLSKESNRGTILQFFPQLKFSRPKSSTLLIKCGIRIATRSIELIDEL